MRLARRVTMRTVLTLVATLAVVAACGTAPAPRASSTTRAKKDGGASTTTTAKPSTTAAKPSDGFSCAETTGGSGTHGWLLQAVRAGEHDGYDRVTFELAPGPGAEAGDGPPEYHVRLAEPPFTEDPSGQPLAVPGSVAVQVVLQGVSGVDLSGPEPRQAYTGPRTLEPSLDPLEAVVAGGDFESTMTWYLGLSRRSCYRVSMLTSPTRVVVDVAR